MTRTVVWLPSAEKALAAIWLDTERNEAVTEASYQIDRDLHTDAELNGTPLREGLWVIQRTPLRAVYEIIEADRLVRVVNLGLLPQDLGG
jgi:hypothetical protein